MSVVMENITISVDSELLRKTRAAARKQAKSVNAFIRQLLVREVDRPDFPDEFIRLAKKSKANSRGIKWTRESLYER